MLSLLELIVQHTLHGCVVWLHMHVILSWVKHIILRVSYGCWYLFIVFRVTFTYLVCFGVDHPYLCCIMLHCPSDGALILRSSQLPEERKLDLLKNLAGSSPYAAAQESRQLLPSIVTLLKVQNFAPVVPRKHKGLVLFLF